LGLVVVIATWAFGAYQSRVATVAPATGRVLLTTLYLEGQNAAGAAWLAQQALLLHAFPRGVAALGLANEAGLHLPDANALATAVAHLLPAIISTPLRDGLDWSGSLGDADGMIISLGLAAWRWSPAGIQEKLAYRWMEAVLQQWRANETGPDAADQTAQAWLEQRPLLPEALVTQLWERLPVAAAPEWSYPQPWALAHLVESLCPDNVDDAAVLTPAGEQLGRQAGQALTAAVARTAEGYFLGWQSRRLPPVTNNEAEYQAALLGLRLARRLGATRVTVITDSEVVVRQMQGLSRVLSPRLKPLYQEARRITADFQQVTFRHVSREENKLADALAAEALAGQEVRMEPQPRGFRMGKFEISLEKLKRGLS
jgi:ribonuclease HI